MIIREAVLADLKPLVAFIKRELAAWGYTSGLTLAALRRQWEGRFRFALLEEDGVIVAALAGYPFRSDRGPGIDVRLWLVAFGHAGKVKILDALALWACNRMRSEGVRIITSRYSPKASEVVYARDLLGMAAQTDGVNLTTGQVTEAYEGDTEAIIKRILEGHPEWVL